MPKNQKSVRVAVNVMRARLTVIGFNIAIVSFQIVQLYRLPGGLKVHGLDSAIHVAANMTLFMALALSLISLVAFIMSCDLDEVGVCIHWTLVVGDLLMYLGLAHTVAGFFAPLAGSIEMFAARLPDRTAEIEILRSACLVGGGAAWFLSFYVGPVVSLLRSPFPRPTNIALGVTYLVLLLALSWVSSHAIDLEAAGPVDEHGLFFRVLRELVQPWRW